MVANLRDERVRHGLIGLIAMRRARAEHERKAAEAAGKKAEGTDKPAPKPRRRGWFG